MARPKKRRQWGSGEVHRIATGWQVRWRENGRRRTSGGFATQDDAERVLAKIRGDLATGRAGLPPDPRALPTLAELVPGILERRYPTHRSADCDEYRWNKHLAPHFGHLKPTAVDVARIRTFIELLSAVFVDLTERGLAASNPCRGLPDSIMRTMRPTHDPKTTPFVEK